MITFKDYLEESSLVRIYHGDNFNTKKLDPKLMMNGNNQEGVGIYFSNDLTDAKFYGSDIIYADVNTKRFIDSRKEISNFVSDLKIKNLLTELLKVDEEKMFYLISDYVEIYEPDDINSKVILEFADYIKTEEVRNFQITLAENFGVENFVKLWNKIIKIDGTYQPQQNTIWYAVINDKINVMPYTE